MESTTTQDAGYDRLRFVHGRRLHHAAKAVTVTGMALVALFAGACAAGGGTDSVTAGARPAASVDSVGRLAGSDGLVAVVAAGDRVTAYVCDGTTSLGERFTGTMVDGRADLRSASGAALAIGFSGGGSAGQFTPAGGEPVAFTTAPGDGESGMYFADGKTAAGPYSAGWIELDDGTQTGTARIAGAKSPAPRLKIHKPHRGLGQGQVPTKEVAGGSGPGRGEAQVPVPPTKEVAEAGSGGPGRGEIQVPPAPATPPTKEVAEAGSGGPGRGEIQVPPAPATPPTKEVAEAGSGGPGRGEIQVPPAPATPPTKEVAEAGSGGPGRGEIQVPPAPATPPTKEVAEAGSGGPGRGEIQVPPAPATPPTKEVAGVAGGSGPARVPVDADPASLDTAEADLARVGRVQAIRVDPQAVRSGANTATSASPQVRDLVARRGRVS